MSARFKGKGKSERYVWLRFWLMDSPAWRSLPVGARAIYIELARRYNGSNNGRIPYSVREAVALHISPATASRLLEILRDRGFIVCTRKGAFSLKTTKDASEWQLTEYASDHPPAHATKNFMRWRPPEDVDIDTLNRLPSHHRKSKTRLPQRNRTVTPVKPSGYPRETVKSKKRRNGYPRETVEAKNATSTVTPVKHLQLPGIGSGSDVVALHRRAAPTRQDNVVWITAADRKPWTRPSLTEISFDDLVPELQPMALELKAQAAGGDSGWIDWPACEA